jgi:predicted dehydrogenase
MSATALRIGVLGAARVAVYALIAPARAVPGVHVTAVAARDRHRARDYAKTHDIPLVLPDYEALIASREIDIVYNALPPSRHADLTIAALQAGKHVLCEKPFAMNATEARAMVAAARRSDRVLMEAFHYRYHPLFAAVLEHVARGDIGPLEHIDARFFVRLAEKPGELRFDAGLGGGALMDLGTYCLHWCRAVTSGLPRIVDARCVRARSGVDLHTEAMLAFDDGSSARIECGFDADFEASLTITGSNGEIRVRNPLVPQHGHALEIKTVAGIEHLEFERTTTYLCQLRALEIACRDGAGLPTGGQDAIDQMTTIDAVRTALNR